MPAPPPGPDRQAYHHHLANVAHAVGLARLGGPLDDEPTPSTPTPAVLLAGAAADLDAARRILGLQPGPLTALLAPTRGDVSAAVLAARRGGEVIPGHVAQAMLEDQAARLAARLPTAGLWPPTPDETDALVALWRALPDVLSEQGVVTALVTMWAAIRRGDATLADLTIPAADPDPAAPTAAERATVRPGTLWAEAHADAAGRASDMILAGWMTLARQAGLAPGDRAYSAADRQEAIDLLDGARQELGALLAGIAAGGAA